MDQTNDANTLMKDGKFYHNKWVPGNPPMHSVRELFHTVWSKAVGTQDYDKRTWQELESQIEKLLAIYVAVKELAGEKSIDAEQKLWDVWKKYQDFIKVTSLKTDFTQGVPEPPPGLFGK